MAISPTQVSAEWLNAVQEDLAFLLSDQENLFFLPLVSEEKLASALREFRQKYLALSQSDPKPSS